MACSCFGATGGGTRARTHVSNGTRVMGGIRGVLSGTHASTCARYCELIPRSTVFREADVSRNQDPLIYTKIKKTRVCK
jgi:hypothetical protein